MNGLAPRACVCVTKELLLLHVHRPSYRRISEQNSKKYHRLDQTRQHRCHQIKGKNSTTMIAYDIGSNNDKRSRQFVNHNDCDTSDDEGSSENKGGLLWMLVGAAAGAGMVAAKKWLMPKAHTENPGVPAHLPLLKYDQTLGHPYGNVAIHRWINTEAIDALGYALQDCLKCHRESSNPREETTMYTTQMEDLFTRIGGLLITINRSCTTGIKLQEQTASFEQLVRLTDPSLRARDPFIVVLRHLTTIAANVDQYRRMVNGNFFSTLGKTPGSARPIVTDMVESNTMCVRLPSRVAQTMASRIQSVQSTAGAVSPDNASASASDPTDQWPPSPSITTPSM